MSPDPNYNTGYAPGERLSKLAEEFDREIALKKSASLNAESNPVPVPSTHEVAEALRSVYPHGHRQFLPITINEIKLHSDKNHDYAKGGSTLGNFERVAGILSLYPNLSLADQRVVAIVYLMKQLDAVLWGLNQHITHKVEGANSRLQDISVYTKIIECMNLDMGQAGVGDSMKGDR